MSPQNHELEKMEKMMKKNADLLEENNRLLRRMYRFSLISFWFRVLSYALIIGLPFAIYFYVLEPYFAAFGASYEVFIEGLNELPGLKGIDQLIGGE